jgi:hypothetical protein
MESSGKIPEFTSRFGLDIIDSTTILGSIMVKLPLHWPVIGWAVMACGAWLTCIPSDSPH